MNLHRKSIRRIIFGTDDLYFWETWVAECPHCDREITDTEDYTTEIQMEDHIHMTHGPELDPDHYLFRPSKIQRLVMWLDGDPHTGYRGD